MVSKRLRPFLKYPFDELEKAKDESVRAGIKVIDFGVGDPERLYVKEIEDYLIQALQDNDAYRYPCYEGEKELRESFCKFYAERYGVKLEPEKECLVLIGSKEGIAHIALSIVNPGELCVVPDPGYPVYSFSIKLASGRVKRIRLTEKNSWLPELSGIDSAAKLIFVNYPSNPTGSVAPAEFFNDLVRLAKRIGAIVVNDAAYAELYFDKPTHSILEIPGAKDLAADFHSASKTFGAPGLRIGFIVGSPKLIAALAKLKKNIDSGQFKPIQKALANAYKKPELIDSVREIFKKRRKLFYDKLKPILPNLNLPPATFYIWWKIPEELRFPNSYEFSKFLINKFGVVVLPGAAMGKGGENYVRFSLTLDEKELELGCDRLVKLWSEKS